MLAGGENLGDVVLGGTLAAAVVVTDSTGSPKDPAALPTFRVYGLGPGPMANGLGTLAKLDTGSLTSATNATPIVVASATHNLQTGQKVTVSGVVGNAAANGDFTITKIDANSFSLDGSSGNGAYISGGTWHVTGVYQLTLPAVGGDGYQAGGNFYAVLSWVIAGSSYSACCPFRVV